MRCYLTPCYCCSSGGGASRCSKPIFSLLPARRPCVALPPFLLRPRSRPHSLCSPAARFGLGGHQVLKRMALDQFAFAPCFIPCFMSSVMLLEGKAGEIPGRLRASWADAVQANWALWIPAQVLNFKFIPLVYQVNLRSALLPLGAPLCAYRSACKRAGVHRRACVASCVQPIGLFGITKL